MYLSKTDGFPYLATQWSQLERILKILVGLTPETCGELICWAEEILKLRLGDANVWKFNI